MLRWIPMLLVIPAILAGCNQSPSRATAETPSAAAPTPAEMHQPRLIVLAKGIEGVASFGESPDLVRARFGEPTRTDERKLNGKPTIAFAYDNEGVTMLFVENKLFRFLISGRHIRTDDRLGVGSSFDEVHQAFDVEKRYGPGASGTYPFAMQHRETFNGEFYILDSGRTVSFFTESGFFPSGEYEGTIDLVEIAARRDP